MSSTTSDRIEGLSLRRAFEAERARREAERRTREEAEQAALEADFARADQLWAMLEADPAFLAEKGLRLNRRSRYRIAVEHPDFELTVYFRDGVAEVTAGDKRTATLPTAAPRKQETAESVEDALLIVAQFLADESQ